MSFDYRVYFISSYESSTPKQEYYTEDPGFHDYKREFLKQIKYDDKDFDISINSFSINKKDLIKNKETDTYDLIVKLKIPGIFGPYIFSKTLSFDEIKNHFIYGFKLDDIQPGIIFDGKPPKSIIFSKMEQLDLYIEFLKRMHSEPGDTLSNAFCEETVECLIKDKKFDFDFYLELLQYYKNTKNITKILDSFKPQNCEILINFNASKYESTLEQIESNQEMYTKYCLEDGEDVKIKKKFYTLLLYFRYNNKEREKLKILISDKNLWSLFGEIINQNEKCHQIVELAEDGLIQEIMKQKKISFDCVKKIIASLSPVERLLSFINNNYDYISKNCREECLNRLERTNSYTNLMTPIKDEEKFGIKKKYMGTEQEKLLNFFENEENAHRINHKKFQIILFNKKDWDLYFRYKEIELFIIKKSIYICLKYDKRFEDFKKKEKEKIEKIINTKNEEFLQKLSNDISEYEKTNYGIYIYPENEKYEKYFEKFFFGRKSDFENKIKPFMLLNIFDGIDLRSFGKEDLKKWNIIKTKVFELKDIKYDLETYNIIKKIKNLDEFDKFLNFYYSDKDYNYELLYEQKLISNLGNKFLSLISKSKSEEYLTRIASNLIYKYDQLNLDPEDFISDIEKIINENKINIIYEYLTNNYELTSDNLIDHMADCIIRNNNIPIIKNLKNIKEKIIPIIFAKIDNCIKDTMLYDNKPINTYFILLNDMNEEGYSQYAGKNISNISRILKILESGMVSYELMNSIYDYNSRKELFEKKISILLFRNESKIAYLIKIVKNYLNNINKNLTNLAELKAIIEKYYSWKYEFNRNISLIDTYVNSLKKGLLNEFTKTPTKDNLDKLNKIYVENDFHKKYIMKDSLVLIYENKILGNNRREIDNAFNNISKKYNELKVLFDKNWQTKIKDETIHNYYDIIQQTEEDEKNKNTSLEEKLKKDLQILSKYHCSYKTESEINKLRDDIIFRIDCIDIQSFLNKKISYWNSRNTPSSEPKIIKLNNAIENFNPEDISDKGKIKSSLFLENAHGYQMSEKLLSIIK